jgi:alkylhydroperoxidase/carboxymuconolactone decarboxylase family protein YurZ
MSDIPDSIESYMNQFHGGDPGANEALSTLARNRPDVLEAFLRLRRAVFEPPDSVLSPKVLELVALGIECARQKSNPPPVMHARLAVDAGATLEEISAVVALCIPLAGMMTYVDSGQYVLRAAEERVRELQAT